MILAEDEKSDLSQVATSHLIRLIIIITVFPFIVNSFYDVESIKITEEIIKNQNISHLILLIISSIIFIIIFDKLKIHCCFVIWDFICKWIFTNFRNRLLSIIT